MEATRVHDLESRPSSCQHVGEQRGNNVRNRFVQQLDKISIYVERTVALSTYSHNAHAENPKLEGDESDILALSIEEAGRQLDWGAVNDYAHVHFHGVVQGQ